MAEEYGILRIQSDRRATVNEVTDFLLLLESAYNNLYAFIFHAEQFFSTHIYYDKKGEQIRTILYAASFKEINNAVPPQDRLILHSVIIQSPGFGEFLGVLSPLEVIRNYLQDKHERRKDYAYREAAEREKLDLENEILRTQAIRERVALLQEMGFPDEEIQTAININVIRPLILFDMIENSDLITEVSVRHASHEEVKRK